MSEPLRRSARILAQKSKANSAAPQDGMKLYQGQGLALKSTGSYKLAVAQQDVNINSHSFLVTLLKQTGNELKYQKDQETHISFEDIIREINIKPEGKYYKITKKELYEITASIEESSEEEVQEFTAKKRKTSSKPIQVKKTKMRKQIQLNVYKKGVGNPNVQVLPMTDCLLDPSDEPKFGISMRINNLNFHRAVATNNKTLFENLLASRYKIGRISESWGPEHPISCTERAILLGNEYFVKAIIQELRSPSIKKGYDQGSSLSHISTGSVCIEAYGVRTRKVQMSRGGREGNNAFYFESQYNDTLQEFHSIDFIKKIIRNNVSPKILTLIISLIPSFTNTLGMCIGEAIRSGNLELSSFLVSYFNKQGGYGLNFLHEEVLQNGNLSAFKKPSITKKPIENYLVAPLHAACINPNPKHLNTLIASCDDLNYLDQEGRKAVHYAAACTSFLPLKALLDKGMNPSDPDKNKITPLMISAQYNRVEPAELLMDKGVPVHVKSKDGRAAIHFAAENGSLEVLRALLNNGANIDQPGTDRKTPLMFASMHGHFDCIKELLDRGAKDTKKDNRKRSALIFAVKNGHARETSLLLSRGAPYDEPDSSKNYPLHYAAAYGWVECISLLIQAGADVNTGNDWKLQPLLLALLKGQTGCVKLLLEQPGVDVNGKDENGRTLVSQCVGILSEDSLAQLKYLLKEKNADPNVPDSKGLTVLHHLCNRGKPCWSNTTMSEADTFIWENLAWDWQLEALDCLLEAGCNINAESLEKITPVMYALKNKNTKLSEALINKGADMSIVSLTEGGVFHFLIDFDYQTLDLVRSLLDRKEIADSILNILDSNGFSPFLKYVEYFINNFGTHRTQIYLKVKREMQEEVARNRIIASDNATNPFFQTEVQPANSLFQPVSPFQQTGSLFESPGINGYLASNIAPQINSVELESKTDKLFKKDVNYFIDTIKHLIQKGANPYAVVEKMKIYRDDPELIYKQEKNEPTPKDIYGNTNKTNYFIVDIDGNKLYKEYGPKGLQNALHIISASAQEDMMQFLLSLNIPINQKDFYGNTPLLLFTEKNSNFLEVLIQHGADPNIKNAAGNFPIQKAVENQNIETIKSLIKSSSLLNVLNQEGKSPLITAVEKKDLKIVRMLLENKADPNFKDNKNRTSLHIAFNLSESTANASFDMESLLLLYKADINAVDIRNRIPLHYSFIKIGKSNDMSQIDPIEPVSSACALRDIQVNVQDKWNKTPLHYAAQRGALTSSMFLLSKGALIDLEDNKGNTPLALAIKEGHANYAVMLVQKGANVMKSIKVIRTNKKNQNQTSYNSLFGFGYNYYNQSYTASTLPEGTFSMFKAAIIQGWQGLAYLLIFNGYPYMLAMQDSMTQNKFQLVKTLLAKVSDNSALQQVNELGQNLFHTLAIYGAQAEQEITQIICEQLIERGVSLHLIDVHGRSPLHYACQSNYYFFMSILLSHKVDHKIIDKNDMCPLAYIIESTKIKTALITLKLFRSYGAEFNFKLKENGIVITPLLHAIKERAPADVIKYLLDEGCSLQETDSLGRNAFMYGLINNDTNLIKALLTETTLSLFQCDFERRNALHYAVQSLPYGSYENTEVLRLILTRYPNLNVEDINNDTPYTLASKQRSGRLLKIFKEFGLTGKEFSPRKLSQYEPEDDEFDYLSDAEEYTKTIKNLKKISKVEKLPDENGEFPDYYVVYEDFDLIMTKVDLTYGPYSAYVFYRMQLLIDTNRDVYVLYTRWGRIGEVGASQRTPFSSLDEAQNEFKKIFKSKSGNEWGAEYEKKPGKYMPMALESEKVRYKDFIVDFNLDIAAESILDKDLEKAIKDFSSQTIYRNCFRDYSLNIDVLNFSNLSKATIEKAETLLLGISRLGKALELEVDTWKKIEIIQEIQEQSSRYYELIPIIHSTNSAIAPIIHPDTIKKYFEKIYLLKNIELASKVILGALRNQELVNPYDYIYRCLDTNFIKINEEDEEYKLIKKYLFKGGHATINSIFKLQRKGEMERISKYSHVTNRKLLWHGTNSANIVGILMEGLKIAPPEVPNTGYMFGKGVYFADYFGKSKGYCSGFNSTNGYFIFLCEVVLGEMLIKYSGEFIEKLPEEYLSTFGCGSQGPNPEQSVYTPYGVEVPLGDLIAQSQLFNYGFLSHNEYIVYDTAQIRLRYLLHLSD